MVVAAIVGLLAGAVSFMPLLLGQKIVRTAHPQGSFGQAGALLLGVLASILVLAACTVICVVAARDVAVAFAFGEVIGLIVAAVAYGISVMAKRKK